MDNAIANLFSWTFVIGVAVGFFGSRVYCAARIAWMNRTRPLPGGRARDWRAAFRVDPRHIAGVIGALFLCWSVFQTNANAERYEQAAADTQALAEAVRDCNAQLISAIRGSRGITSENDQLSQNEREQLAKIARLQTDWVAALAAPPADVAKLPFDHPVRQRYNMDVTADYLARVEEIHRAIAAIHDEQNNNVKARPPLPDPNCGT
ncbi:hypothetical protein SEA_AMOCHICK_36 [Mycobacterium phage Amochick]|uniref:Uncharacterized protein n=2 Tax=Gilesvirus giles TaxID=1982151 RepID=A0A385D192_9CAUD|nr:hypothetical protein SEA_AMOCHICK_36 [Mycobacterium phage Amochick]QBQ71238.1 hypothetical protein SEA_DAEGAL_37 [Mycobacterium phage Daegal]